MFFNRKDLNKSGNTRRSFFGVRQATTEGQSSTSALRSLLRLENLEDRALLSVAPALTGYDFDQNAPLVAEVSYEAPISVPDLSVVVASEAPAPLATTATYDAHDLAAINALGLTATSDGVVWNADGKLVELTYANATRTSITLTGCEALTKLDVSGCPKLQSLSCYNNALTTLDVSGCSKLASLSCFNNALTTLDVSGCANLAALSCLNNALTTLDLSNNAALTYLYCDGNDIASLDVSANSRLGYLQFDSALESITLGGQEGAVSLCVVNSDNWTDLSVVDADDVQLETSADNVGSVVSVACDRPAPLALSYSNNGDLVGKTVVDRVQVVTTLDDVVDATDGFVSLREAIVYAGTNENPTITFASALQGGTITLSSELTISKTLTIDATSLRDAETGALGITISGANATRVFNVAGGTTTLECLRIADGAASATSTGVDGDGGAIYVAQAGTLTVVDSEITGGSARRGGALFLAGEATLTNSVLSGNAASFGGAVFGTGATGTFFNCTIAGNVASTNGGGARFNGGTYEFYNTIVAGNESTGADADLSSAGAAVVRGFNALSSFSGWGDALGGVNFVYDASAPLFADAANGDYSLAYNSQAVNKGNDAYATVLTDLVGNARNFGGAVDLGAYEYQADAPSTIVTTLEDVVDSCDGLISLREAIVYAGNDGLGTTITFDQSLKGGTITLVNNELKVTKSLTIDASDLYDAETKTPGVAIDADGKNRIFYASIEATAGDETTDAKDAFVLKGLTLTGGRAKNGAAIYSDGVALDVQDSVVADNAASQYGGALMLARFGGLSTSLRNVVFTGNSAGVDGGAVNANGAGDLSLTNCAFESNASSGLGGALSAYQANSVVINGGSFLRDTAGSRGGAVRISGVAQSATITDVCFTDNASS